MAAKFSTGLRTGMLVSDCFSGLMSGMVELRAYSGTAPATADAAIGSATLLATFTESAGGDPLQFDAASAADGILHKAAGQAWEAVVSNGTPTFFRIVQQGDDGSASTTARRIQGSIGVVGADLNFASVTWTAGQTKTINAFAVVLPTYA